MKRWDLIVVIGNCTDRAKNSLCDFGTVDSFGGMERIFSRISGTSRSMPIAWVTRARVIPSRRAISPWLVHSPASRRACHSMALRRSSTTRGTLSSLGRFGLPLLGGTALPTLSDSIRRFIAPMSPFSEAPFGPSAISTVCSR